VIRTWGRNGPAEQLLRQGAGGRVRRLAGNSGVTGMDYWLAVGITLQFGSTILICGEACMIVYSDEVDMVREVYPPPRPAWRSCR
jgi:hypothetical protein